MFRAPSSRYPNARRRPKGPAPVPLRFTDADFDAAPGDAASVRFARRMGKWAQATALRLRDVGACVAASVATDSDTRCAVLTAVPVREAERQRSLGSTRRLAVAPVVAPAVAVVLRLDAAGVRVGIEVPPGAAPTVRARASDPAQAATIEAALRALPEQFFVGVDGHDGRTAAPEVSADVLARSVDRAVRAKRSVRIEWCVPREIAVRHAGLLDEEIDWAIVALVDALMVLSGVQEGPGGSRSRPRGRDREEEVDGDRRRRAPSASAGLVARAATVDDEAPNCGHRGDAQPGGRETPLRIRSHAFSTGPKTRAAGVRGARVAGTDPAAPVERGSRVCVMVGPFSGKVGVVQELDGKGGARVRLGLLAVQMRVKDLAVNVSGQRRPMLASSHRKPVPARS